MHRLRQVSPIWAMSLDANIRVPDDTCRQRHPLRHEGIEGGGRVIPEWRAGHRHARPRTQA